MRSVTAYHLVRILSQNATVGLLKPSNANVNHFDMCDDDALKMLKISLVTVTRTGKVHPQARPDKNPVEVPFFCAIFHRKLQ